jgi:phosphoribosylpyrophosphate synthetase
LLQGAKEVIACCTHAVFSPPAIERLSNGDFEEVIITDTIPHSLATMRDFPQVRALTRQKSRSDHTKAFFQASGLAISPETPC